MSASNLKDFLSLVGPITAKTNTNTREEISALFAEFGQPPFSTSVARILQWEGLRMTSHLTIRCIITKGGLNFKRDILN